VGAERGPGRTGGGRRRLRFFGAKLDPCCTRAQGRRAGATLHACQPGICIEQHARGNPHACARLEGIGFPYFRLYLYTRGCYYPARLYSVHNVGTERALILMPVGRYYVKGILVSEKFIELEHKDGQKRLDEIGSDQEGRSEEA